VARGHASEAIVWALEDAPNPSVVRLHVDIELTGETIVRCPPGAPPDALSGLAEIGSVRSIDLHRYRARLNLRTDADREAVRGHADAILTGRWGPPSSLGPDAGPRAFEVATSGPRAVAESPAMAQGHGLLEAVFAVDGVAEAIAGEGLVLVRLGRLFGWADREDRVREALQTAGGTPGSTSSPV
jgi:hypothetical protein